MACRKWMVRGLVFSVTAMMLAGAVAYYEWTNPVAMRALVLEKLTDQFVGVRVTVESAHLRLLGGISVSEVRFTRKDDPEQNDFLYIPSAIIYHDKEQLVDGKLAILKVELHRPRLRVVRSADGSWNLAGVLTEPNLNERMPMLVFRQATVVVEDRKAPEGTPPVEIKDLNFTLVNDPLPKVTFDGAGVSDMIGRVHAHGYWMRATGDADVSADLSEIPVGPNLAQRLAGYCPDVAPHVRQLEGTGNVEATLTYHPQAQPPLDYDVRLGLSKGKFTHSVLPAPLEEIEASVRLVNGRVPLITLNGRSGGGTVAVTVKDLDTAKLMATGEKHPQDLMRELEVKIDHLNVTEALYKPLPAEYGEYIWREYRPTGPASMLYTIKHENGGWKKRLSVTPEGADAEYVEFRYPVKQVVGSIVHESGDKEIDHLHLELVGRASGKPVYIKGDMLGDRPDHEVNLTIWGEDLPLDEKVDAALLSINAEDDPADGAKYQAIARSFHPSGRGDFKVFVHRDPKKRQFDNRYVITFHDCAVRYDPFQTEGRLPGYRLENVSGVLDLRPPNWVFHDFRGTHKGGEFFTSGRCTQVGKDQKQIDVNFVGKNFLLDGEMKDALDTDLQKTWDLFVPEGRVEYSGRVVVLSGAKDSKPDIDLTVSPQKCVIRPTFFPYRIADLTGKLHYRDGRVDIENMRAANGKSRYSLNSGYVLLKPDGGAYADLRDIHGTPVYPTTELLDAMPAVIKKGCVGLELKDPLALTSRLVILTSPDGGKPDIFWDGRVAAHDISMRTGVLWEHVSGEAACRGRYDGKELLGIAGNFAMKEGTALGQTLTDCHGKIEVRPDAPEVLRLPGVHANFCGGEVYGPVRVEFGSTLRYELNLTASQVKLEEFGRQNLGPNSQLSGLAVGQLYLAGEGSDPSRLTGNGTIDVPNGKLYNLPKLVDLLKFLDLRFPDRTLFEEAHVQFGIEGQKANVRKLDLIGNVISLHGKGDVDYTNPDAIGLGLDFNVDWARINQVLPQPLKTVETAVSTNLYKVKVRGTAKKPEFSQEPLPGLAGPLKELLQGPKSNAPKPSPDPNVMNPKDATFRGSPR